MTVIAVASSPSRRIAAEVRAEAARQGLSLRELALKMGVSHTWVTRRVSIGGAVEITFEELDKMAGALGVSTGSLLDAARYTEVPLGTGTDLAA